MEREVWSRFFVLFLRERKREGGSEILKLGEKSLRVSNGEENCEILSPVVLEFEWESPEEFTKTGLGLHPRDSDLVLRSLPAHTFAFLINSQMLPLLLGWGGRRRRSTFLLPFLSFPSLCKDTGLQTGYCESHRTELEKDPNLSSSRLVVCPCVSRVSTPRESPEDDGFFLSVDPWFRKCFSLKWRTTRACIVRQNKSWAQAEGNSIVIQRALWLE